MQMQDSIFATLFISRNCKLPGGGGIRAIHFPVTASSRTIKYNPANPASSTPLSSASETRCNLLNSVSSGLSANVAWIEPIWVRNTAMRGLTACCEITVSPIINTTHNAAGAARLANVRVRASRTSKKITPHTMPAKCIRHSAYPTIAPAWSRDASTENAPGATTKLKNASLPSHRLKLRNSIVRSKFVNMISNQQNAVCVNLFHRALQLFHSGYIAHRVRH